MSRITSVTKCGPRKNLSTNSLTSCSKRYCASFQRRKATMRLLTLRGWHGRKNDVLFQPATNELKEVTVYFCGDIQDLENKMVEKESLEYTAWSLENTSRLFQRSYPNSCIVAVRPSRKHMNIFNFFDNFVNYTDDIPILVRNYGALAHLAELLKNLNTQVMPSAVTFLPIRIIGFSKGCTVLNQMTNEIHSLSTGVDETISNLVMRSIKEMCWIDAGHIGTKDAWITDPEVLRTLGQSRIRIQVHVSPYQITCNLRPWIGQEYFEFVRLLKRFEANLTANKMHFKDDKRSIEKHFELLKFNELC